MKKLIFGLIVIVGAIIISCADSAKKELEKSVKIFLTDFQNKLKGNDEEIFKLFATGQNKDEILKAIRILQNRDSLIKTKILFDSAQLFLEDIRVEISVELISKSEPQERTSFALNLFRKDGKFYISHLLGEKLYNQFFVLKNKIENAEAMARLMADIKIYYDRARELQKNYDTIVWYAHHKNMTYYYAVNGQYNFDSLKNEKPQDFKMGLIDETGKVIVPVAFDLIGNPSINLPEAVEVKKNGKIGYYSLEGKEIVPTIYEWLIPYEEKETMALVKKDSTTYGWLDRDFIYHENFPSAKAEQNVKEFSYLTDNTFLFGAKHNEMINILYPLTLERYDGTGMVIPPAYFVQNGVFSSINDRFLSYATDTLRLRNYMGFGYDFFQAKSEKPFSISSVITGFITEFKNRFIGGRGEFYTSKSVVLVDEKKNLLGTIWIGGGGFKFRKMNDTLYQYSFLPDLENEMGPGDNFPETNYPVYGYFKFDGKRVNIIECNRRFAFTKFNKLDSSYLAGDFKRWDDKTESFLSNEALSEMRNEILANYGFIFTEKEQIEWYKYQRWYKPSVASYEEVYSKASEIDKYNLDFLNRLIRSTPAESNL